MGIFGPICCRKARGQTRRYPCIQARFPQADAGTRTPDPFITSEVLYQLSYVGAAMDASDVGRYRFSAARATAGGRGARS